MFKLWRENNYKYRSGQPAAEGSIMQRNRARVPGVMGLIMVMALGQASFAAAQSTAASGPPAVDPRPATPEASGAATQDIGWPRQLVKDGATLVYYQPQLDEWKDYKQLKCRMAFALTPAREQQVLGVASLTANTIVDSSSRTAFLRDITVTSVRFPSADPGSAARLEQLLRATLPVGGEPISIDRVMAMIERENVPARTVAVKNEPPTVFYSGSPALLLLVEGEPVFAPIEKTDLEFVVNTNWDLFHEKSSQNYFLLGPTGWLTASALNGPWTPTQKLPKDMAQLPVGENFDDVKRMVPARAPSGPVPAVFYSNVPAELVLLRGAPIYSAIPGTRLLYVTNTDGDVFVDNASRQFFLLLSGRWFRADTLGGPFAYAGDGLPADFAKIPANSPKASVLAAVPGTQQAADAVMLAQIPTSAVIDKAQAEAQAKVTYDGPPQFKAIENTTLQYAINTEEKVIRSGDLYYLCFQGVWFISTKANGPWKTADSVPAVIYTIPPTSPVYNVTYVTQSNATSTTVESSHTAGYYGMFVIAMAVGVTIAFGTGYYYPPYIYRPPGFFYPVYRPWPMTYGVGAVYNPRTGGYAVGRAAYGPYGAARSSAWYNPATGRYGRSASVQTAYGGRTSASAYNPWTGSYARTQQGHNAYAQWGASVATRGNQWLQTGHVTTAAGTTAGYRTSAGKQGTITRGPNGTVARTDSGVYAGRDGEVYKRNGQGDWSRYDKGGGWSQVERASPKTQQLDSSARARERGQAETQRQKSFSNGGQRGGAQPGAGQRVGGGGGGRRR
ncbi:MAG TPA: hypothetical protein VJV79_03350 [Polyangiaceae bacterium]|nr:hypothetical protein [Polyangiaceae bacterium]